jgi:8-oxo-dGTP pyrophosphatase MutT (NUDIX family)
MAGDATRLITIASVRDALARHAPREEHAPEARPAAVALVLTEAAAGLAALFIERAARDGDPWSGQIALPGGRRDPRDSDLRATAVRETREETGVDLTHAASLGALDDLYPRTPVLPPVVVRPFVFAVGRPPAIALSDEVRSAFWVSLSVLRDPATRREVTLVIRGERRTFPGYALGEHVIWGMTERIVTPFLDLIAPAG